MLFGFFSGKENALAVVSSGVMIVGFDVFPQEHNELCHLYPKFLTKIDLAQPKPDCPAKSGPQFWAHILVIYF